MQQNEVCQAVRIEEIPNSCVGSIDRHCEVRLSTTPNVCKGDSERHGSYRAKKIVKFRVHEWIYIPAI